MVFSKRNNLSTTPPITIRDDAPDALRYAIIENAHGFFNYDKIRSITCKVLIQSPDPRNWSEVPNIRDEVLSYIRSCEWYKVYDVAEVILNEIEKHRGYDCAVEYAQTMNEFFVDAGIGWQFMPNEGIVYRGDDTFTLATANASEKLSEVGFKNAATELREAIHDISRRPKPDLTGAISHSMNAIECVGQKITNNKTSLGKFIEKLNLPKPLDEAIDKLYGFSSQHGRHVSEQSRPSPEDAELLVLISCAVCTYLLKKEKSG